MVFLGVVALAIASCSTSKENTSESENTSETTFVARPYNGSLAGEWLVKELEIYDTLSIKPLEINPDEPTTVIFTDSTYHFKTNCNLLQGNFNQTSSIVRFSPGMSTRMACPDMRVETALNEILPQITGIGMENDSTLRFIADNPSAYMIIQKVK